MDVPVTPATTPPASTLDLTFTVTVSIYDATDTPANHLIGWLIDQLREQFAEAEYWLGPDEILAAVDLTGHHHNTEES